MFNDLSTPLSLLHTRRSGKPRNMISPGPDAAQLDAILAAAVRVPDHGKLAPWRFVVIGDDQRSVLSDLLTSAYRSEKPSATAKEIEAMEAIAHQAPTLIIAVSSPKVSKIPVWEQHLSAGAACMQLLNAAHASGFVASWLTGWPSYSDVVRDAFGNEDERIAGFMYIGTASTALDERPRPDPATVVTAWQPSGI